ncbi:hypothetical protein [Nocardioides sp.]
MLTPFVVAFATEDVVIDTPDPFLIGGIVLVIFLALIGALLAFGKGREHS